MIFILFVLLLVLTFFSYILSKKELISPAFILSASYVFCMFISLLNFNSWGDLSIKTVFVVLLGVLSFVLGCALTEKRTFSFNGKKNSSKITLNSSVSYDYDIKVGYLLLIVMLFVLLGVAILYFRYIMSNAFLAGSNGSVMGLFSYARSINADSENYQRMSMTLTLGVYIAKAYGYVTMYIILREYIYKPQNKIPKLKRFFMIMSILIYLIITILSTGRTALMNYIVYTMIVACLFYKIKTHWSKRTNKKVFKTILISFIIILVAFRIIDLTLRQSIYGSEWSLWVQISRYFASQFYALDIWLQSPTRSTGFDDTETLYNLYSVLNRLGANIHIGSNALEGIKVNNLSTNIYTSLRRYIHDYGYIGMVIIQFLTGAVFTDWFKKIQKSKKLNDINIILYASLFFTVVFNCIEERTLINIFSLAMLVHVIVIIIMWRCLIRKKRI